MKLEELSFPALATHEPLACACGKTHIRSCGHLFIARGALASVPEAVGKCGGTNCYILADENTYAAAGKRVTELLTDAGIPYTLCLYHENQPEPDEKTVGTAFMHFDTACDCVVAVGGGVMNDTGKMVAAHAGIPHIIVATAPSMDGFASASSSMARDGLKVSLNTKAADAIVADLDILAAAPRRLIVAGLGDMLAKYVSICEWRIAALLLGEFYCPSVAALVRNALAKCVGAKDGVLSGDPEAARSVMEGMVIAGLSMNYAGISRPASGMEHYISHIWDMRGLAFGTHTELHGTQCAVGTVMTLRGYEWLMKKMPDREKALAYVAGFDLSAWEDKLREIVGGGAESMIAGEHREHKYDAARHALRLDNILAHWEEILGIMREELPSADAVASLLHDLSAPATPAEAGFTAKEAHDAFLAAKDIRDKYVLGRLLWDFGLLEECADALFPVGNE